MKNRIKKIGIWLVMSQFIFTAGCKKYDEGPAFSLQSKKARIEGSWNVASYTENGVDGLKYEEEETIICKSGKELKAIISGTMQMKLTFEKDGDFEFVTEYSWTEPDFLATYYNCVLKYITEKETETYGGEWDFSSDKEKLILSYKDGYTETWDIVELKNNEIKLKSIEDGVRYELTLRK